MTTSWQCWYRAQQHSLWCDISYVRKLEWANERMISVTLRHNHFLEIIIKSWVRVAAWGASGGSLHVVIVSVWVFARYSSFQQKSKDMCIRLIGDSKLPLGIGVWLNGACVLWWTSRLSGVYSCLSRDKYWDRLKNPTTLNRNNLWLAENEWLNEYFI